MACDESVYNLIPREEQAQAKGPLYHSKHNGRVPAKQRPCATMGRPNGCNADHPAMFLRAHLKEPVLPQPGPPSSPKAKVKPPVPGRSVCPVMGLRSNRDFVTTNALEAILAKPKQTGGDDVDWTARRGFGKAPAYLKRNQATIAAEKQQIETYLRMQQPPSDTAAVCPMAEDERRELLAHLKAKWVSLNLAYQRLGFVTELECQKRRKEGLEAQLKEVEGDIQALERGSMVLVVQDC